MRIDGIDVAEIDRFRLLKVKEGRISNARINKMVSTIAAIMEVAVDRGYVASNPAAGRRRRLKVAKPKRTFLDRPEQIEALFDAAGVLDERGRGAPTGGRCS